MKILILGGSGMLGHRLWLELSREHEVCAVNRSMPKLLSLPGFEIPDIRDMEALRKIIVDFGPDVVINCVGIIKQVDDHGNAEKNITLNSLLPHQLARLCALYKIRLILFSTDCVFSGRRGHYKESDFADADDIYGRTKKLGEIDDQPHVLTLRTSIVGRELRGGRSLVEWFLAQEGKQVLGYKSAIFSGLPTKSVAEVLSRYVLKDASLHGLYHLSSNPISKYDLLTLIKNKLGMSIEIVPDYKVRIDRSLDSARFKSKTGYQAQSWNELVDEIFPGDLSYSRYTQ